MAHWQDFYPGKILRISYEHLVQSPEAAMQGVLRHCGMPWEPAVLDFHSNPRSVSTASLAQVHFMLTHESVVGSPPEDGFIALWLIRWTDLHLFSKYMRS